jgi:type IV pilus assembly protein PilA
MYQPARLANRTDNPERHEPMIKTIKQRLGKDHEEGFTLIELMVVLLIIAILLAIAIPTFLGSKNTANARAAQSNVNTAIGNETTYIASNGVYGNDLSSVEPSLHWVIAGTGTATIAKTDGSNAVLAVPGDIVNTGDAVVITALGSDGNCYSAAMLSASSTTAGGAVAGTYYAASKATTTGCASPALPTTPITAAGAASTTNIAVGTGWFTSW